VRPRRPLRGTEGHAWEQLYLRSRRGAGCCGAEQYGALGVSRQVCTIHDIIPIDRPDWFSPRFSAWYNWLLPKLVIAFSISSRFLNSRKRRLVERLGLRFESNSGVEWRGCTIYARRPTKSIRMRREVGISSRQSCFSWIAGTGRNLRLC